MQSRLFQLEISKVFFIVHYNRYIIIIQAQTKCAFSIIIMVDAVSVYLNKANTESATVIFTLLILQVKKRNYFCVLKI